MIAAIHTKSGSLYVVTEINGEFWLSADNVPNPETAKLLGDACYPIANPSPWPPKKGEFFHFWRRTTGTFNEGDIIFPHSFRRTNVVESVELQEEL